MIAAKRAMSCAESAAANSCISRRPVTAESLASAAPPPASSATEPRPAAPRPSRNLLRSISRSLDPRSLGERTGRRIGRREGLIARDRLEDLVVIPGVFRFLGRLHFDQIEVVHHQP